MGATGAEQLVECGWPAAEGLVQECACLLLLRGGGESDALLRVVEAVSVGSDVLQSVEIRVCLKICWVWENDSDFWLASAGGPPLQEIAESSEVLYEVRLLTPVAC